MSQSPRACPTTSPTFMPSMQPSIVIETVTIGGSLSFNVDICKYNEAELTAFSEATIATIRGCACPGPNPENTNSDEVQKSLLRVEANKEICCPVNCRNHLGR